jgi:hypothetical protein
MEKLHVKQLSKMLDVIIPLDSWYVTQLRIYSNIVES